MIKIGAKIKSLFNRTYVTINIEDSDIRYLVIKGKNLLDWGSIPLPQGSVKDGLILNYRAVGGAINELIETRQFDRKKIVVSLSGFQTVQRTIELPKMARKLLDKAILNEAKQTLPVSLEQLYLSWQKISEKKGLQRFFLLGIPKNLLDSELKCLKEHNITPKALNIKPLALAGLADRSEALIIDVEAECCEIVLVAEGLPAIMRFIPMHSSYSSQERAKLILQEFERTLGYYEANNPDHALSRDTPLLLTGKLANDEELIRSLSARVGFKIKQIISPFKFAADFRVAQYAVNIGLALKKKKEKFLITGIDILPKEYLPRNLSSRTLPVGGVLVGVALILPFCMFINSAKNDIDHLKREETALQASFTVQQNLMKEARQVQAAINNAEAAREKLLSILQDFDQIGEQRQRAYTYLCTATNNYPNGILPQNVILTSISQENNDLRLSGSATSYELALQYADALRHVDGFSDVQVHSLTNTETQENQEENIVFVITLGWN